jgi:peptidoglycan/LPS O-acetylase OafA/YrhL
VSAWRAGRELAWGPTRWLATHPGGCWAIAGLLFGGAALSSAFPRPFTKEAYTTASYVGEHVLYGGIALFVMLPAVFGEREGGLPRRLLGTRPLRWLGRISYGLFLWHSPLLKEFGQLGAGKLIPQAPFLSLALVGMPVVIACAWLSWRFVEQPALRLAHRRPDPGHAAGRVAGAAGQGRGS